MTIQLVTTLDSGFVVGQTFEIIYPTAATIVIKPAESCEQVLFNVCVSIVCCHQVGLQRLPLYNLQQTTTCKWKQIKESYCCWFLSFSVILQYTFYTVSSCSSRENSKQRIRFFLVIRIQFAFLSRCSVVWYVECDKIVCLRCGIQTIRNLPLVDFNLSNHSV